MRPLQLDDVVIGQYKSHTKGGVNYPGYTDDKTVPKDSLTPTFAAAALFIDNARWDGVPFLMKAGKALHTRRLVKPNQRKYIFPFSFLPYFFNLPLHTSLLLLCQCGNTSTIQARARKFIQ